MRELLLRLAVEILVYLNSVAMQYYWFGNRKMVDEPIVLYKLEFLSDKIACLIFPWPQFTSLILQYFHRQDKIFFMSP